MPNNWENFKALIQEAVAKVKGTATDIGLLEKQPDPARYDPYLLEGSTPEEGSKNVYLDLDPLKPVYTKNDGDPNETLDRAVVATTPLGQRNGERPPRLQYFIEKQFPANSLVVRAHGGAQNGQFMLKPSELSTAQFQDPISLDDVARRLGSRTNDFHNVIVQACNEEGLLTPEYIAERFPNVTNSVFAPKSSASRLDLENKLILGQDLADDAFDPNNYQIKLGASDMRSFQKDDTLAGKPIWRNKRFSK